MEHTHDVVEKLGLLETKVSHLESRKPSYFKDKIAPSLIVAFVVGGVGVYGTFMVYGQRIESLEAKVFKTDERMTRLEFTTNSVAIDVAYIRGKLEGK